MHTQHSSFLERFRRDKGNYLLIALCMTLGALVVGIPVERLIRAQDWTWLASTFAAYPWIPLATVVQGYVLTHLAVWCYANVRRHHHIRWFTAFNLLMLLGFYAAAGFVFLWKTDSTTMLDALFQPWIIAWPGIKITAALIGFSVLAYIPYRFVAQRIRRMNFMKERQIDREVAQFAAEINALDPRLLMANEKGLD